MTVLIFIGVWVMASIGLATILGVIAALTRRRRDNPPKRLTLSHLLNAAGSVRRVR